MKKGKSSYYFEGFGKKSRELEILKRQSHAAIELEKSIWKSAGLEKGMNVIDLGCGTGIISCELAKYVRDGSVLGIDISKELIYEAEKHKIQKESRNVSFVKGDAYNLQIPENSFDFVYARFLLQHLGQPEAAFKNILRVLKPAGILCVVDIDDQWLILDPEPHCLKSFLSRTSKAQELEGGNRFIGRKLGRFMHAAGFANARTDIISLSTDQIEMRDFLSLTIDSKIEQLPGEDSDEIMREVGSIHELEEEKFAWGALGIFIATGSKP